MFANFIAFVRTREFLKNLAYSFGLLVAVLIIASLSLSFFTRHGDTVTLPNLVGLSTEKAIELLESNGFSYKIDSIFIIDKEPGSVLDQIPKADAAVKEGRTIYLTVVSMLAPTVKLPNLKDVSLREATAILESYGLKVGKTILQHDFAENAVLAVQQNGKTLNAGRNISKGSTVDLVIGDGQPEGGQVQVPELINLTRDEAQFILQANGLSLGSTFYDPGVTDSLLAKIYRQSPEYKSDSTSKVNFGGSVNIFLK